MTESPAYEALEKALALANEGKAQSGDPTMDRISAVLGVAKKGPPTKE